MSVPENHIIANGPTLNAALFNAAEQLGIETKLVAFDYNRAHFTTETGRPKGVLSVQVFAWEIDSATIAGAQFAQVWLKSLTDHIGIETDVSYNITGSNKATITLNSEQAGRLVGRKGTSLHAISYVFKEAMSQSYADWDFNIDVTGGARSDSENSRDRYRDRDRDRDSNSRGKKTSNDIRKLENRATRLATKVIRTGEPLEMYDELNSFERRVVHQAIQKIDGVISKSVEVDGVKKVHLLPAESDEA